MQKLFILLGIVSLLCMQQFCPRSRGFAEDNVQRGPAAWGDDHVGKPLPEFITGDECLFCHRNDVGPAWTKNRHHLTVREAEPESAAIQELKKDPAHQGLADSVKLLLGDKRRIRFLKPGAEYGKLDLLNTEWVPPQSGQPAKLVASDKPDWNKKKFALECAGCHASGVEAKTHAFGTVALDCFVCHGDVTLKHTKDTTLIHLSKKRNDPPPQIISICAQCHVRTGNSKSTGLPYPNQFVAGDNLFRDFQVDVSSEKIRELNPADRHVQENVRDVVILGKEDTTCLSCHEIHKQSSKKHHTAPVSNTCLNCHPATGSKKIHKEYEVHSNVCGY